MHPVKLLQNLFEKASIKSHKKRFNCVFDVVLSLVEGRKLWISDLGRNIKNKTTAKHNIKKVDSLIGNEGLHSERLSYYKFLSSLLLSAKKRPVIIVDWSPVSGDCKHYFLRASIASSGRALTLYEEVHELKYYANPKVHKLFLDKLQSILPDEIKPIMITDAGFRNTWFSLVLDKGWDFVGRLRYNTFIQMENKTEWENVRTLHPLARKTPIYFGKALIARQNPLEAHIYLISDSTKGRFKKTKHGKKCHSSNSNKYAKSSKEPWVLVSSLKNNSFAASNVIKLYRLRMQIESSFRDIKNKRHGFRLPESGTKNIKRLENLLLIALLAMMVAWLAGQVAINKEWHFQIQANTVRKSAVLSIFFIGLHVLRNLKFYKLNKTELIKAIVPIKEAIAEGLFYSV